MQVRPTPRMAAARPLTEPTDRSISPSSSTSTMPMAMVPTAALCRVRLTRLRAERKSLFRLWKTAQMMIRPTTTGSEPRSPLRSRLREDAETAPLTPREAISRSSWRSAGSAAGSLLDPAGPPGCSGVGGVVLTRTPPTYDVRPARETALSVAPVIAAMMSCELVSADVEDAVVAAEPQHGDPVGDRHDVGHVVADQDHAEAALAQPLDEVEHLGGLRDAEGGGGLVEHDDLGLAEQRAGDRDGLALAAGERGDRDADRGDLGGRAGAAAARTAPSISTSSSARRCLSSRPRKRFADDVEVVAQREVLEHGRDAELAGPRRGSRPGPRSPSNSMVPSSGV